MQDLYSLIHSLTSSEWQSLQNYFTCFSTHDPVKLKYLQLATLLMNAEECPSDKYCCLKIYGVKNGISFEKLKSRLKEKILDFLLTDISADKQKELDEADYAIIKMKKKSAQFQQLFYSKKRMSLLYGLLDEIISLAKEYEQYSLLIEHLRMKKGIVWKRGKEEFKNISKEMDYYSECNRMANKAEHYYYELMIQFEYSGKPDNEKLFSFFEKTTAELDMFYEQTKSALIKYHHKFLELGYYQQHNNYLKARSICLELLDVVRNNKSVYRRQRIGVVYDNLSRCEFYLGHFEHAAEYAREAQKNFNLNSENYCIALEQEFYALFALQQYDKAIETANKMLTSASKKELGEFRFSKYNYLLANALFKQHRYQEALHLLSQERELSKDKAGWETGARTLKIMTLIELLKLDEASLAVYSLKQFFKYTDKKTSINLRDKKILNLLLVAEKKGFMFTTLNGNTDKYMKLLSSPEDKNLHWQPFTHEVIPFHEWFARKMGTKIKTEAKEKIADKVKVEDKTEGKSKIKVKI